MPSEIARRTVSNLLPLLLKIVVETPSLKSVPLLVVGLVTVLSPLEKTFAEGDTVHADNAEPEEGLLPFHLGHAQQGHSEGRLADGLSDDGADGRRVDENMHAVVPAAFRISCCVLDGDDDIGDEKG